MQNLRELKRELIEDHWKHVYNWNDFTERVIFLIARRHRCAQQQVRDAMQVIERQYPKPRKLKG